MKRVVLAEFLGIMLGDGNIYSNTKNGNHRLVITGHSEEDYDYLVKHVKPLIKNLFSFDASIWKHKNKNAIALAVYSKNLINDLLSYGLVSGPKTMEIPKIVIENKKFLANFLKGIADTDFSVLFTKKKHCYPHITATFSNRIFTQKLRFLLSNFGINSSIRRSFTNFNNKTYVGHRIDIYGRTNLERWLNIIGFSNPKHLTKIEVWKRFGYCLPKTTYKERLGILNKKTYK